MITKEQIADEIAQLPESDLQEFQRLIEKLLKQSRSKVVVKNNVFAQLRQIKIEADADFSTKVEL